ncbi:hypothetical protein JGUZn3_20790 [Entomobacter blattae]|uniref:Uncharacterized protein n=1 Tax=Entomobacter blattae TaxID=2762277 RepID=A0A7H1NU22_9PROT|nr:hypothetical protein JGUZn3_20790 [Entomobacter blattae]
MTFSSTILTNLFSCFGAFTTLLFSTPHYKMPSSSRITSEAWADTGLNIQNALDEFANERTRSK